MTLKSIILIAYAALIISLVSLSKCNQISTEPKTNTTTIDLFHIDFSPKCPSYDPSLSHSQRLANALQRPINRFNANTISTTQLPETDITNVQGTYYVKYSIGTPPVLITSGIANTGGDLIWTQCDNLKGSTTYKKIPCNAPQCKSFPESFCSGNICSYSTMYGDGSSSQGDLSTDTVTLGTSSFPNVIFGCGTKNRGSSGVVGLGGGEVSLIRQLGQQRFSYCLVPFSSDPKSSTSKLHFGTKAVVSGKGTVRTPLVTNNGKPTFYYVTLRSITVGNQPELVFSRNMIVDTGTTKTMLPSDFYNNLIGALKKSMIGSKPVNDPRGQFDLCYSNIQKFPDITLHFNNADVKWKQGNIFAQLDKNLWCLAAGKTTGDAIYGSLAQTNFLVGFDLDNKAVSFQPTDCVQRRSHNEEVGMAWAE